MGGESLVCDCCDLCNLLDRPTVLHELARLSHNSTKWVQRLAVHSRVQQQLACEVGQKRGASGSKILAKNQSYNRAVEAA